MKGPAFSFKMRTFSPISVVTLLPGFPYSHCNLLIWTESEEIFKIHFPESILKYTPIATFPMTFNLIPFENYSFPNRVVIDSLIFVVKNPNSLEKVKEISSTYVNISIQVLVFHELAPGIPLIIRIPTTDQLLPQLYTQQCNLEKLLREIFEEIDEDFDGYLQSNELSKALNKLNPSLTPRSIEEIMKEIDLDKDGKVSFNEFSYWWKRGRQRVHEAKETTIMWSDHIKSFLPRMNFFSEKEKINKGEKSKQIQVVLNSPGEPKFSFGLRVGKSAKREEILRGIENDLSLNIYDCWLAVCLQGKNESVVNMNLEKFESVFEILKPSLLASLVRGQTLLEDVQHQVIQKDKKLMCSFSFEPNNEAVNEFMESFTIVDKFLTTPVDDFVALSISTDKDLMGLKKNPGNNLLDSLGNGEVRIESQHWSMYADNIEAKSKTHNLFKIFAEFEGRLMVKNPNFTEFEPLFTYISAICSPLKDLCKTVPSFSDLLDLISSDFTENFTFYLRFLNLGLELKVCSKDLIVFIKDL